MTAARTGKGTSLRAPSRLLRIQYAQGSQELGVGGKLQLTPSINSSMYDIFYHVIIHELHHATPILLYDFQ